MSHTETDTLSVPPSIYNTKNRIAAVDITRIMAAFAVMFLHLNPTNFQLVEPKGAVVLATYGVRFSFGHVSYVFLFFAGYFACRNLTWKKVLTNAFWTLAPFLLWNGIYILIESCRGGIPSGSTCYSLMGVNSVIFSKWHVPFDTFEYSSFPLNVPLWFMRDLVVLHLLSPLICRYVKYLFPLIMLSALLPGASVIYCRDTHPLLSFATIAVFASGCYLRSFSSDTQKKFLQFNNIWIILGYIVMQVIIGLIFGMHSMLPSNLWHIFLSVWVFYQIARWTELHIPCAREFALKYAPVTFLTFAMHWIIYSLLPGWETRWPLIYPFISFGICAIFFFLLKKYCRPLLHLVAHYRLRPDDMVLQKKPMGKQNDA